MHLPLTTVPSSFLSTDAKIYSFGSSVSKDPE
jgi:hypothetical protein